MISAEFHCSFTSCIRTTDPPAPFRHDYVSHHMELFFSLPARIITWSHLYISSTSISYTHASTCVWSVEWCRTAQYRVNKQDVLYHRCCTKENTQAETGGDQPWYMSVGIYCCCCINSISPEFRAIYILDNTRYSFVSFILILSHLRILFTSFVSFFVLPVVFISLVGVFVVLSYPPRYVRIRFAL